MDKMCVRCGEYEATIPEPEVFAGIPNVQVWCKQCFAAIVEEASAEYEAYCKAMEAQDKAYVDGINKEYQHIIDNSH
jgi:hypothetical protein